MKKFLCAATLALSLSACASMDQLGRIGKAPEMSESDEVRSPEFEPSLARGDLDRKRGAVPTNSPIPPAPASSASLFRAGAGALFHDQRASRVGDILTVRILIEDEAEFGNSTSRQRNGSESFGIGALLGLNVPGGDEGVDASSDSRSGGRGKTSRSETIKMTMAAIVTDVLPNGNLMIKGRQEMRVNFELRELIVTGIVRPEDISRDNSVAHSQIAEARISYGGRGQLTDVQQARWGQQIYEALFPF